MISGVFYRQLALFDQLSEPKHPSAEPLVSTPLMHQTLMVFKFLIVHRYNHLNSFIRDRIYTLEMRYNF
jgi:hypothetical protein